MGYIDTIRDVLDIEMNSIRSIRDSLDITVEKVVEQIVHIDGIIVLTGMGKSGHICKKIVATMQSLGIKSFFIHPAEALHGDLGLLSQNDVLFALSNSGETQEILDIIPSVKKIGTKIICMVGKPNSTLECNSDFSIVIPPIKEAYLDGLVPTSSTTSMLALGDAISIAIASERKFTKEKFGLYHPHGMLGKRLTMKVSDIMVSGSDNSVIEEGSTLQQAIFEMCRKPIGGVTIVDRCGIIRGIFTDGDFRRFIQSHDGIKTGDVLIDEVMVTKPITLCQNDLIYDAIQKVIKHHSVSVYPVVDNRGVAVGTIRTTDIVKSKLLDE